jgi:hypothetical protein
MLVYSGKPAARKNNVGSLSAVRDTREREKLLELLYYTDKPGRRSLLFFFMGAALKLIRSQTQ